MPNLTEPLARRPAYQTGDFIHFQVAKKSLPTHFCDICFDMPRLREIEGVRIYRKGVVIYGADYRESCSLRAK